MKKEGILWFFANNELRDNLERRLKIHHKRCIMSMQIIDYFTTGGKNLILSYIDKLPKETKTRILKLRKEIEESDYKIFEILDTKKLFGKLYEIRISNQRIAYVIIDKEMVYFVHIFKKQKNKTEKDDLDIAINRARKKGII